jgi:hypothetical protein
MTDRSKVVVKVYGAVLLCILGLASLLFSSALLVRTISFVVGSKVVPGEIVEVQWRGGRSQSWMPVFKYVDLSGVQRTGKGIESSGERWQVGQRVGVRYSQDSPERATIDSFREIWMVPLFVLCFALGFSAFAVWFVRSERKQGRTSGSKR